MIELYSGTPGSGKSLHQASKILEYCNAGFPAVGNTAINPEVLRKKCRGLYTYIPNDKLTVDLLVQISRDYFKNHKFREERILLVIDEAQILFNARDYGRKDRAPWLSFFSQHRKFGYHIILVAQFDRMIDRQIRCLIEYEEKHRKVGNIGIGGAIFNAVALGGLFCSVRMWYPLQEKVGVSFFKYRRKLSRLYDSYAVFAAVADRPQTGTGVGGPRDGCAVRQAAEVPPATSPRFSLRTLETGESAGR